MLEQKIQLIVSVLPPEDTTRIELEEQTSQLRETILETDVDDAEWITEGSAPDGARAGDPVSLGTLVVTCLASGGVVTTLIHAVQSWLAQGEKKSVSIEYGDNKITLTGYSSEEAKELVQNFISHIQGG